MPNPVLYVTIDKEAFKAAVQKYLDTAPIMTQIQALQSLTWPDALKTPQLWTTIKLVTQAVKVVASAVEVAKQNVIKAADPDGSKGAKFDSEVALDTAVSILGTLIHWNGCLGAIINKIWGPVLNLLVSIVVNGMPKDWASIALAILQSTM